MNELNTLIDHPPRPNGEGEREAFEAWYRKEMQRQAALEGSKS